MFFTKSVCSVAAVLLSLLFVGASGKHPTIPDESQSLTGFTPCDALLKANLSHALHLPSSPLYRALVENGTYGITTRKEPWCFVLPSTPAEVSTTLAALRSAGHGAGDWHIAIRSGGHGSGNQNNIAEGVTIDLTHLNTTSYDASRNVASVGTGARWGSVYAELEKDQVSVTGGREAVVGVGGLILGGGVSWYTARTGFACDSVVNFEVVLASGEIVNANASSNPDLWKALKGGSSNFGIVTRFDLTAFPAQNLSIERKTFTMDHSDEVVDAISGFTDLDQSFDDNALISVLTYDPESETSTIELTEVNIINNANSTAFDAFDRIPASKPPTQTSISLADSANRTQLSGELLSAGPGTLTIANDPRVMRYCIEQYDSLVEDMQALLGPKNFSTILDFQPFPSYFAEIGVQKGGNMLGLERDSRNKILFVVGVTLLDPNSATLFPVVSEKLVALSERVKDFAKSLESDSEFVYLPYAKPRQDAIGSYGTANIEHIRCVAKKYDPHGFFQRRVPGGYKIDRVE